MDGREVVTASIRRQGRLPWLIAAAVVALFALSVLVGSAASLGTGFGSETIRACGKAGISIVDVTSASGHPCH